MYFNMLGCVCVFSYWKMCANGFVHECLFIRKQKSSQLNKNTLEFEEVENKRPLCGFCEKKILVDENDDVVDGTLKNDGAK